LLESPRRYHTNKFGDQFGWGMTEHTSAGLSLFEVATYRDMVYLREVLARK
jgi:hypothetical protein